MNLNRFAVPALAVFLGATGLVTAKAYGAPQGPPPPGYGQERGGWDVPPQELNEIQRRGFRDGIEGARKDFGNNRQPDVNNRDEYRNPDLPPELREQYREGFRRGYRLGVSNLMGQPQGPMGSPAPVYGQERGGWDAPPQEFQAIQRQGFQDGIEGARKDFGNHRQPDVNNRDEYRNPHLPPEQREAYREGFRRGYERAMSHLMGEPERR